jgi:hypothetical protein
MDSSCLLLFPQCATLVARTRWVSLLAPGARPPDGIDSLTGAKWSRRIEGGSRDRTLLQGRTGAGGLRDDVQPI